MHSSLPQRNLRRLSPDAYQGLAWVHWSMTIENRKRGWLTPAFHRQFDLILLHTCARYHVICPAYCLMPDHLHVLLMGIAGDADQRLATRFFRTHLNQILSPFCLQRQAYEHVLEESERSPNTFENTVAYIRENPARAGLVREWSEWGSAGSMVPGYPNLDPRDEDFWNRFWKIHHALVERNRVV